MKRVFGFRPKLHRGGREKCKNFYEKRVQLSVSANLKKKKYNVPFTNDREPIWTRNQ